MVETAVYALLGALATALVALLALPAVSRRAFRLAEARARLMAPLSAAEAQAERDALRARHAVEVTLIERQAGEARDQWAEAQIALGRQAADIARRDEGIAALTRDLERERAEIARLGEEQRRLEAVIAAREATMLDLTTQGEAGKRREAEIETRHGAERARADDAEAAHAKLEGRFAALAREFDEALRASDAALDKSRAKISALERQADEASATASDAAQAPLRAARAERDAALRELQTLRLQQAGAESDADLRETIARLGREIVESRARGREAASSLAPSP